MPNQVAVDEIVIQLNDERRQLYAAFDLEANQFLHMRLFQARTT
jgi:transposase-like protein